MQLTAKHQEYWNRNLRVTAILLFIWFFVTFVIGYYALWASADAIILASGADVGFLLRVVPNALYYGGLVPVIAWTAPTADR